MLNLKILFINIYCIFLVVNCATSTPQWVYHPPANYENEKNINIYIDKHFTLDDKIIIQSAINELNVVLNNNFKLIVSSTTFDMEIETIYHVMSSRGWLILKVKSNNSIIPNNYTLAWVNKLGGNTMHIVRDRFPTTWLYGVVLHEMAHLLGAEHNNSNLMQAKFNYHNLLCVDKLTAEQIAIYNQLLFESLNYCAL
jgi:hypothetical protein